MYYFVALLGGMEAQFVAEDKGEGERPQGYDVLGLVGWLAAWRMDGYIE